MRMQTLSLVISVLWRCQCDQSVMMTMQFVILMRVTRCAIPSGKMITAEIIETVHLRHSRGRQIVISLRGSGAVVQTLGRRTDHQAEPRVQDEQGQECLRLDQGKRTWPSRAPCRCGMASSEMRRRLTTMVMRTRGSAMRKSMCGERSHRWSDYYTQ